MGIKPDDDAATALKMVLDRFFGATEQVKAAFALPAVQQEILAQEATELCEQVDAWLAAVMEEE